MWTARNCDYTVEPPYRTRFNSQVLRICFQSCNSPTAPQTQGHLLCTSVLSFRDLADWHPRALLQVGHSLTSVAQWPSSPSSSHPHPLTLHTLTQLTPLECAISNCSRGVNTSCSRLIVVRMQPPPRVLPRWPKDLLAAVRHFRPFFLISTSDPHLGSMTYAASKPQPLWRCPSGTDCVLWLFFRYAEVWRCMLCCRWSSACIRIRNHLTRSATLQIGKVLKKIHERLSALHDLLFSGGSHMSSGGVY